MTQDTRYNIGRSHLLFGPLRHRTTQVEQVTGSLAECTRIRIDAWLPRESIRRKP